VVARLRWPPVGAGAAVTLVLPKVAAEPGFGPWRFAATAAGSREFREVHAFRSRRACGAWRHTLRRGVVRVIGEHGGTTVAGLASRLTLSACTHIRGGR
jgi:hypothetical protein